MAASEPNRAVDVGEAASTEKQGPDVGFWAGLGPIVKREPVVKLLSPVSGLEALTWSEDHRLAVSTVNSVSIMELVCDQHTHSQGLVLHRTHIPVPEAVCELKVSIKTNKQTNKRTRMEMQQ